MITFEIKNLRLSQTLETVTLEFRIRHHLSFDVYGEASSTDGTISLNFYKLNGSQAQYFKFNVLFVLPNSVKEDLISVNNRGNFYRVTGEKVVPEIWPLPNVVDPDNGVLY